jgi:hypothetical protein
LIDPDKQEILIVVRRGRGYETRRVTASKIESTVVKGFWIDASWLWAEPLPSVMGCLRKILG